jgi:hypothetical protein
MGGGLMQLVAYGAQDVYLTGNPQITFFKVVYRRHTNFSMETIEHTLSGSPDFGRKGFVTIARNGDLANGVTVLAKVKALTPTAGNRIAWVKRLGHALIKSVEVSVGGSKIDKHYGTWMDIWYELSRAGDHDRGYDKLIGNVPELTTWDTTTKQAYTMHIPLQFWFCRNSGLALPLIALQYHEVVLNFEFAEAQDCVVHEESSFNASTVQAQLDSASVLVDYVYLDSEERRRFAQVGHEYLIEQVQFTGEESANSSKNRYRLGFNHPSKEIVWAMKNGNYSRGSYFAYASDNDFTSALGKELVKQVIRLESNATDTATATDAGSHANALTQAAAAYNLAAKIAVDDSVFDATETPTDLDAGDVRYYAPSATGLFVTPLSCVVASSGNTSLSGVVLTGTTTAATNLFDLIDAAIVQVVHDGSAANALANYSIDVVSVVAPGLNAAVCSQPRDTWTVTGDTTAGMANITVNQPTNYGVYITGELNPTLEAQIQLNGHDRFSKRLGDWFNYRVPLACHTNTPADGINVYSFSLHPEKHQPGGSSNLSRIDDVQLSVWHRQTSRTEDYPSHLGVIDYTNENNTMYIYCFSYNVLRIMSGMGGLAYSN